MGLPYLKLDSLTTEFVVTDWEDKEHRFPGTVIGSIGLHEFCIENQLQVTMSSDLNHPEEFPKFEKHAIDIAVGYYDNAVADGVIEIDK